MQHIEWNWKTADGLTIYSQGWLPAGKAKAVLCLVHGLGEHTGRYAHVASALLEKGYALVGFDLRGHGRSEGRRGHTPTANAYLDDIDFFLTEVGMKLPGVPRYLYGHSFGGILVLTHPSLRAPVIRGVIATAPAFHSAIEKQVFKKMMAVVLGTVWPTLSIPSGLVPATLSRDPKVVEAYVQDPLVHNKITTGCGKLMMDMIALAFARAAEFPVPYLLMHGGEDKLGFPSGSQEFASRGNGKATLKIWPGLYHEIHNEPEKEQVFQVMLDWLAKH